MGSYEFLKPFVSSERPAQLGTAAYGSNWFLPVARAEIDAAEKRLGSRFPASLRTFYEEVGAGFLRTSHDGQTVWNHPNRLVYPDEVVALRDGESDLAPSEGFDDGELPFFEVGDGVFLVMKPEGNDASVWWSYGEKVADDFETFIRRMYFEHPRYYA